MPWLGVRLFSLCYRSRGGAARERQAQRHIRILAWIGPDIRDLGRDGRGRRIGLGADQLLGLSACVFLVLCEARRQLAVVITRAGKTDTKDDVGLDLGCQLVDLELGEGPFDGCLSIHHHVSSIKGGGIERRERREESRSICCCWRIQKGIDLTD